MISSHAQIIRSLFDEGLKIKFGYCTVANKWFSYFFSAEILTFDTHLRKKRYDFISAPWEHFCTLSMIVTKPGHEQKNQKIL